MNLTLTAEKTKKMAFWGVILLIALIFLRLIILIYGGIIQNINSNKPLTANNLYGNIPSLSIPSINIPKINQNKFYLTTINGQLPTLPSVVNVYPFIPSELHLLSYENALTIANLLNFKKSSTNVGNYIYSWTDNIRTLQYDLKNQNITINSNIETVIQQYASPYNSTTSQPLNSQIDTEVKKSLSAIIPLTDDYVSGKTTFTPLSVDSKGNINQSSGDSVQAYYINIFRSEMLDSKNTSDKAPVLSVNPNISNINLIVLNQNNIADMSFIDRQVGNPGLYSIKSVSQAWQELTSGKASLVYLQPQSNFIITPLLNATVLEYHIKNIYLAYYEPSTTISYLQPIYVFSGDAISTNGQDLQCTFYLPAL